MLITEVNMPRRFVLSLEQHEVTVSAAQPKSRHYDEQNKKAALCNRDASVCKNVNVKL